MFILQLPPSHKFRSVSIYAQTFSRCRPLWDKCTEWPQDNLEHCIWNTIHVPAAKSQTQISLPFALQLAISNILAISHFPIGHKVKFLFVFQKQINLKFQKSQ